MAYEMRPDSGSVFKNQNKTTEKHPDYTGTGNYKGETFRIAVWIREGRKGKFLSVAFSEPRERNENATKTQDGEIPF